VCLSFCHECSCDLSVCYEYLNSVTVSDVLHVFFILYCFFPTVSPEFFKTQSFQPHYDPGVDSTSNRNEYQEYFLGGKGSHHIGMTNLHVNCLEIWKPQPSGTLRACANLYRDCYTFVLRFFLLYLWFCLAFYSWYMQTHTHTHTQNLVYGTLTTRPTSLVVRELLFFCTVFIFLSNMMSQNKWTQKINTRFLVLVVVIIRLWSSECDIEQLGRWVPLQRWYLQNCRMSHPKVLYILNTNFKLCSLTNIFCASQVRGYLLRICGQNC
jgi:hypothetical protein